MHFLISRLLLSVLISSVISHCVHVPVYPDDTVEFKGFHVAKPNSAKGPKNSNVIKIRYPERKSASHSKDAITVEDKYKPWGAASLPNPPNHVILDKIDDELFTADSEIHSYDQARQQETRYRQL